jgi:hypothetical protein
LKRREYNQAFNLIPFTKDQIDHIFNFLQKHCSQANSNTLSLNAPSLQKSPPQMSPLSPEKFFPKTLI